MSKTCSRCGLEKDLTEFYKNCRAKSGYRSDCKVCHTPVVRFYQSTDRGILVSKLSEQKRSGTKTRKASRNRASRRYKKTAHGHIVEKAAHHKRRERSLGLDTNFTAVDIAILYVRFNHQCFMCGSKDNLSIDHHRPLAHGFGLSHSNAVLLCGVCNSSKGTKSPEKFYQPEQLKVLRGQGVI